MKYKTPTYEEYCKASKYAKIRYRFGVFIQLLALILLIFLIYYTVTNVEEITTNPKEYAERKLNVECVPIFDSITNNNYVGRRDITDTGEW